MVLLGALFTGVGAAQAAPEYEITGTWITPPATISRGNPVVAEWHFNVNDDLAAPTNGPVDNVTATFVLDKAVFDELPDLCLTTGVTPVSSISPDGTALTCNFGPVNMGTAISVQTPVVATGITGEFVNLSGTSPGGETVPLPPIPIENTFAMDIYYGDNVSYQAWNETYTEVVVDIEWTLRLGRGSDPGPDSVTYLVNVSALSGANVDVGAWPDRPSSPNEVGCTPFALGATAGHPYSGHDGLPPGHPQETNFVDSCTLVETATPGVFELTLTGIDYSLLNVPSRDSAGNPLPTDWDAIASGMLWFRVFTNTSGSINLDSNEPLYTSPTGLTYTDDAANNLSNKPYTLPGGWSSGFYRPFTNSGGNQWSNTYRLSAGTTLMQFTNHYFNSAPVPPTTLYGECIVFDTAHVTYEPPVPTSPYPMIRGIDLNGTTIELVNPPPIEYYVGPAAADPNIFNCGADPANWTAVLPPDLTTVQAVRIQHPRSLHATEGIQGISFIAYATIHDDEPVGQDIWSFGSALQGDGVWALTHSDVSPTPGLRYPTTTGRRDMVQIISATPSILKAAARATVTPGEPVEFTLTYSANGAGAIADFVDDYVIRDVLPAGMTYVVGSATPAPAVTFEGPNQVLTWTLQDVPTNTPNTLTYEAEADSSVEPGTRLTNTVTSSYDGQTSVPRAATVTMATNGFTTILKTPDTLYIPNPDGSGDGIGTWTVAIESHDPLPQDFTDTIDILPRIGDQRGTAYNGTYELDSVVAPAGADVYYTTADPATLSDDPEHDDNGAAAGDPTGNIVGWTTTAPADLSTVTAIRVIGEELPSGATFSFQVRIATDGALPGDVYVNRAQARAEHTELVMRTSAPLIIAHQYAYELKKYVQDTNGVWHDAQDATDYPTFDVGDDITYRIVVTNIGQGTLMNIDIDDDVFDQGSFLIDSLPAVAPDNVATHEFTVVADESMIGTTVNTACATVLDTPFDAVAPPEDVCDPAGVLVFDTDFDKVLVGKTPNGDGTYTITYDVFVTRVGEGPGYDLTDTLRYGASASIVSTAVTNTVPGGIATNPGWNGTTDTAVASAIPIADGGSHTYQMTVVASIDEPATTAAMSDCDLGGDAGTGFHNTAQLTTGTRVFVDDACVEYPAPVIAKSIASGPTDLGDGRYQVTYNITATNNGVDPTTYDLDDTLQYGNGISIVSTTVSNTSPGGIATSGTWNGTGDIRVATAVPIGGVTVHTYTAAVVFTVAGGISAEALNCTFAGGESGTGLFNTATLTNNGETRTADACAVPPQPTPPSPPPPPSTGVQDPGELPATGGNSTPIGTIAVLLMLLGGLGLLAARQRRRSDISAG